MLLHYSTLQSWTPTSIFIKNIHVQSHNSVFLLCRLSRLKSDHCHLICNGFQSVSLKYEWNCNHLMTKGVRVLLMFCCSYSIQCNIAFSYSSIETNDCYSHLSTKTNICRWQPKNFANVLQTFYKLLLWAITTTTPPPITNPTACFRIVSKTADASMPQCAGSADRWRTKVCKSG